MVQQSVCHIQQSVCHPKAMQNFWKKITELIFAIITHFVYLAEFTFAIKGQN